MSTICFRNDTIEMELPGVIVDHSLDPTYKKVGFICQWLKYT